MHALEGIALPVCRNRSQFVLPLIGQTTKFCWPPAIIVSPLIVHVVVVAVDERKRGLKESGVDVLTFKKSVSEPDARETVFDTMNCPADASGPSKGLPP